MDLLPALDVTQPQVQQMVPDRRRQREVQQGQMARADDEYVIVTWNGQMEQAVYDEAIWLHRPMESPKATYYASQHSSFSFLLGSHIY